MQRLDPGTFAPTRTWRSCVRRSRAGKAHRYDGRRPRPSYKRKLPSLDASMRARIPEPRIERAVIVCRHHDQITIATTCLPGSKDRFEIAAKSRNGGRSEERRV